MKDLLTILTAYEGAIQEDNDEGTEETAARLEEARKDLMEVLTIAKRWHDMTGGIDASTSGV